MASKKKKKTVTFKTSKDDFSKGFHVFDEKERLYKKSSIDDIEKEMAEYGIILDQQKVLEEYQQCFSCDQLITKYESDFSKELDDLWQLNILFDDDCILYYVEKIIKSHYSIYELPDVDYIVDALEDIRKQPSSRKPALFIETLQTMDRVKDYNEERNIDKLFERTAYDFEFMLDDLIIGDMNDCDVDLETAKTILDLINQLLDDYEFEYPYQLYADSLSLLGKQGYEELKDAFYKGLEKFPDHPLCLYCNVISYLLLNKEKEGFKERRDFIRFYRQAISIEPTDENEATAKNIIIENYKEDYLQATKMAL